MEKIVKTVKKIYNAFRHWLHVRRFVFTMSLQPPTRRVVYLMGLGENFPNLGDQAQAAAIPLWLHNNFRRTICEIRVHELRLGAWDLRKIISRDDVVFMHSGGNFGDDWYSTQQLRESIVWALRENVIVQLPQTVHYSDGEAGLERLRKSQRVFGSCKKIYIYGRDKFSSVKAKEYFPEALVGSMPDMVLSLQKFARSRLPRGATDGSKVRKVLMIMRNDKESVYSEKDKALMAETMRQGGYETVLWDTDVDDRFRDESRIDIIFRYLEFISSFDAVVTDRYHGLIFTVLVERRCVVLRTHNHKLTSAFDWFDKVNYVRLADDFATIPRLLNDLSCLTSLEAPDWDLEYFDRMAKEVAEFTGMDLVESSERS